MPWTLRDIMSEATTVAKMSGTDIQPSRVSFYANQAQRDVANRIQQVEYERLATSSTSSGDDKMFLPTDCERVLNLSFDTWSGNLNIPQRNLQDIDAQSWGTQTGTPEFYVSYATWLELYPSPNSAYSLLMRYVARLSDMTSLDAIPSVDTRYHQAVMFKTAEYLLVRQGNSLAASFDALYERELVNQPSARAQRQLNREGMHAALKLSGGGPPTAGRWDWDHRDGP